MTDVKAFYRGHHDEIFDKRFDSPYWIRRHAHRVVYDSIAGAVPAGATVLDAGCGEGVLSLRLAARGARVTGLDLSRPNLDAARRRAVAWRLPVTFAVGGRVLDEAGEQDSQLHASLPRLVRGVGHSRAFFGVARTSRTLRRLGALGRRPRPRRGARRLRCRPRP